MGMGGNRSGSDLLLWKERAAALLEAAISHANRMLQAAKDPYGSTPLFANGVDVSTGLPARLDTDHVRKGAVLSNTASQHHWLRLLAGLTRLTENPAYAEAVQSAMRYLFRHHADGSGLIHWGGHTAFDLEHQRIEFAADKQKVHELKFHYPDYELMWAADPASTRAYIEAFWNAHVIDWSILDFNRHGPYHKPLGKLWRSEYAGGDAFFWGEGLTFVNTGSDLYYSAAMLSRLSGDPLPLIWAKRLAERYVETRQDGVGISGYQFSQSANSWCDGPSVRGDRAQYQLAPLIPQGHLVYEGTLFKPRPIVQRCQLAIADMLGADGEEFLRWSCEEMAAWGEKSYRREDNSFVPMLTDGWSIEGLTLDRNGYFGPKGRSFGPMAASFDFFWMYAAGYRASGDPFLWRMARDIAAGLGIGDIGDAAGADGTIRLPDPKESDHRLVYGMLELHRATGRPEYLEYAIRAGESLVRSRYRDGWFTTVEGVAHTNDPAPLALIHIVKSVRELEAERTYIPLPLK